MNRKKWLSTNLDKPEIHRDLGYETKPNKIPRSINATQDNIEYFQFCSDDTSELSATEHEQQGTKVTTITQVTTNAHFTSLFIQTVTTTIDVSPLNSYIPSSEEYKILIDKNLIEHKNMFNTKIQ